MRKQLSENNSGSEKSRQAKIGGADGGVWCGREFHGKLGTSRLKWARRVERMKGPRERTLS